jgi:hypothetical protein
VITAIATFDHRLLYLDYEGPVSGNRGRVVRWDHGTFSWQEALEDQLTIVLQGIRLHGTLLLKRTGGEEWTLTLV